MPVVPPPPSLEVAHLWNGVAYINDFMDQTTGTRNPAAHVKLTDIDVTVEAPDTVEAHQNRRGSYAYPTSVKSATWEYEGRLRAKTLADLRALEAGTRSAFRDRQTVGNMVLFGSPAWFFQARVMDLHIPKKMVGGPGLVWPFQLDFGLTLRLLDPRLYLLIPATGGGGAGAHTLVNDGYMDSDPTFTMAGFGGGDLIGANTTLGVTLKFLDLPAGDVVLQFSNRTLKVDGVDLTGKMDPTSTWWDENEQGLIAGAQSVTWNTAWSAVWFAPADAG